MDHPSGVRSAVRCCGLYGGVLSLFVAGALLLLSDKLAVWWVEDPSAQFRCGSSAYFFR